MPKRSRLLRLFPLFQSLLAVIICCATASNGEAILPAEAQNAISKPPSELSIMECEGINKCTPWTFFGRKGSAKWPSGEEAVLEIVSWNSGQIRIERTDMAGPRRGNTTIYVGAINDKTMGGSYRCDACSGEDSQGAWYFVNTGGQIPLPQVAHFCDGWHCLTFRLEDGKLVNYTNLPGQSGEKRTLTFTSFSWKSVTFERVDQGTSPQHGPGAGRITEDGLASGPVATKTTPRQWRMSWGQRINDLPSEDDPGGSVVAPTTGNTGGGDITPHDVIRFFTAVIEAANRNN